MDMWTLETGHFEGLKFKLYLFNNDTTKPEATLGFLVGIEALRKLTETDSEGKTVRFLPGWKTLLTTAGTGTRTQAPPGSALQCFKVSAWWRKLSRKKYEYVPKCKFHEKISIIIIMMDEDSL